MDFVSRGLLSHINYGNKSSIYKNLFNSSHDRAFKLFIDHRIYAAGTGTFYLPKQWSPTISNVMRRMLEIDPELKFISVSEKFGKLKLEFMASSSKFKTELMDLVHEAQNRVDGISHGLVDRAILRDPTAGDKYDKWLLIRGILHTGS